jgi:hypothetical protein
MLAKAAPNVRYAPSAPVEPETDTWPKEKSWRRTSRKKKDKAFFIFAGVKIFLKRMSETLLNVILCFKAPSY